jgi:hypothetical protein
MVKWRLNKITQRNFGFEPLFTESTPKWTENLENYEYSIDQSIPQESSKERIDSFKESIYSQFDFKAIKNEK